MQFLISAKLEQLDACSVIMEQAFNDNDLEKARIYQGQKFEIAESLLYPDGVITRLHSTCFFQLIHSTLG